MPMREALIGSLHASPARLVLAVSGGGVSSISDLLRVSGASRTVLVAIVPYASRSLDEWLGETPSQYCGEMTARRMAMRALEQARRLAADESPENLLGVACTASLASDRPKRGEHRAHIALQSTDRSTVWSVSLRKGLRSRDQEDRLVSDMIHNLVAEAVGLEPRIPNGLVRSETWETRSVVAPAAWTELLLGRRAAVCCVGGQIREDMRPDDVRGLLPGSFNPLHAGHRRMAQLAAERLGRPVMLELTVRNADKPPLDFIEIEERLAAVDSDWPVWLTNLPTFESKSTVFQNVTFVVGADTIRRVADPSFYGGDMSQRLAAIGRLAERGCRFLVFGRCQDARTGAPFETLDCVDLPEPLRAISEGIREDEFRLDISSSEIRGGDR